MMAAVLAEMLGLAWISLKLKAQLTAMQIKGLHLHCSEYT